MFEVALALNSLETANRKFSEFINSSETKEKTESIYENSLVKLIKAFQRNTKVNPKSETKQGFWSKYDLEFQNDFQKVRAVWLQGIDSKTKQIKDLKLFNQGYQEFKVFLEKYWSDLTVEDREQFKNYAQQIQEITEFAKSKSAERNQLYFIPLILVLWKIILKRIIFLFINFIRLRKLSQKPENSNNSIFNFIDIQADFAHTILNLSKLYPSNWLDTKTYVTNLIQKAEQINLNQSKTSEQFILETINDIKCLNTVLERNYWESSKDKSDEELNSLEKLGLKAKKLSDDLNIIDTQSNLRQLAFQLEVLADLLLSIVNGVRITELVWEVRHTPRTPEENLEIDRILEEALKGEVQ